jgi:hypothetical protein
MRKGTMSRKVSLGVARSMAEPASAPRTLGRREQHATALSLESQGGRRGAAQVARPEGDRVRDVGGLRRVADGQERREGDERSAAGDGVDGAGGEGGGEDENAFEDGHGARQLEIGNWKLVEAPGLDDIAEAGGEEPATEGDEEQAAGAEDDSVGADMRRRPPASRKAMRRASRVVMKWAV